MFYIAAFLEVFGIEVRFWPLLGFDAKKKCPVTLTGTLCFSGQKFSCKQLPPARSDKYQTDQTGMDKTEKLFQNLEIKKRKRKERFWWIFQGET